VVAYDLHPDYLSTGYALSLDMEEFIACQHHEAHIAGVMGENALEDPVIGIALDGTGYGSDGTIWGGEFFVVRERAFTRAAHFEPVPMPGGDLAAREPWRAAAAYLRRALGENAAAVRARLLPGVPRESLALVERMLERRLNSPLSSGAGRLFDAASSLILGKHKSAYEGQGPMELEQLACTATRTARLAPFAYEIAGAEKDSASPAPTPDPWRIDFAPTFSELSQVLTEARAARGETAWRFHRTVASAVVEAASGLAARESIQDCCLGGGVFQNQILLDLVTEGLRGHGLRVYRNRELPPNDGGISYGQMVLASWRAFQGESEEGGQARRRAARSAVRP